MFVDFSHKVRSERERERERESKEAAKENLTKFGVICLIRKISGKLVILIEFMIFLRVKFVLIDF